MKSIAKSFYKTVLSSLKKILFQPSIMGSYILNHIEVIINGALYFYMHYQQEISIKSSLENVFCSVSVRMPYISLASHESNFFSLENSLFLFFFRNPLIWCGSTNFFKHKRWNYTYSGKYEIVCGICGKRRYNGVFSKLFYSVITEKNRNS